MGGPPMGGPPRQPARQGTSRMVPVVVSAGLAVGVFCGLLFGLGTGKSNAAPAAPVSNGVKRGEDPAAPESVKTTAALAKPAAKAGSNAAVAPSAGSGSAAPTTPAAGSDAGSAEPVVTKLVVEIKPEMAGPTAKVTVDDKEIAGLETEVPMEPSVAKKKVKVKVRALGYRDFDTAVTVELGRETIVNLELIKGRSSLPATPVAGNTDATPPATTPPATTPPATTPPATKTNAGSEGNAGSKPSTSGSKSNGNSGSKGNNGSKTKPKGNGGLIDI